MRRPPLEAVAGVLAGAKQPLPLAVAPGHAAGAVRKRAHEKVLVFSAGARPHQPVQPPLLSFRCTFTAADARPRAQPKRAVVVQAAPAQP